MTEQQIKSLELRIARRQQQGDTVTSEKTQEDAVSFNTSWRETIQLKATPAT